MTTEQIDEVLTKVTDERLVQEVRDRCIIFEPSDIDNEAFLDELERRIRENVLTIRRVLNVVNGFEFDEDTVRAVESLCDDNDLRPALDAQHPIVVAAAEVAFTGKDLACLRNAFAAYGINSIAVFNNTDVIE